MQASKEHMITFSRPSPMLPSRLYPSFPPSPLVLIYYYPSPSYSPAFLLQSLVLVLSQLRYTSSSVFPTFRRMLHSTVLDYNAFSAQPRSIVFIPPVRVRRRPQSEYRFPLPLLLLRPIAYSVNASLLPAGRSSGKTRSPPAIPSGKSAPF